MPLQNYLSAAYASFDSGVLLPNVDHIQRVVLTNWLTEPVTGAPGKDWLLQVGQSLAAVGRIPQYALKSVCLHRMTPGEVFRWYDIESWTTMPWGKGWTDEGVADSATWALDLVFRPSQVGVDGASNLKQGDWRKYMQAVTPTPRGVPTLYFSSRVPLSVDESFSDPNLNAWYHRTRTFWASQQPYWEILGTESSAEVSGYSVNVQRVYSAKTDTAWGRFPPYVGSSGFGYCLGMADMPDSLAALAIAPPKAGDSITSINPCVPSIDSIRAVSRTFSGGSTANLAALGAATLLGAFGAWYLADRFIWKDD